MIELITQYIITRQQEISRINLWETNKHKMVYILLSQKPLKCARLKSHQLNFQILRFLFFYFLNGAAVALWVESSAYDGRLRVWGSPSQIPPCTLMAPGACKIRRGCVVFQVPIQNYSSGASKAEESSFQWRIKIVMSRLRTILGDESQTMNNSSHRFSSPSLSATCLPIFTREYSCVQNNF